jgi:hypothetical protein
MDSTSIHFDTKIITLQSDLLNKISDLKIELESKIASSGLKQFQICMLLAVSIGLNLGILWVMYSAK